MTSFDPIKALDALTIRPASESRALAVVEPKRLYRYENQYDRITLYSFHVLKETPKGFWIDNWGKKKFVLSGDDGKRFAYETKEAALKSFERRKVLQIEHLKVRLQDAQHVLFCIKGQTPQEVEDFTPEYTDQKGGRYFYEVKEDFA